MLTQAAWFTVLPNCYNAACITSHTFNTVAGNNFHRVINTIRNSGSCTDCCLGIVNVKNK